MDANDQHGNLQLAIAPRTIAAKKKRQLIEFCLQSARQKPSPQTIQILKSKIQREWSRLERNRRRLVGQRKIQWLAYLLDPPHDSH